MQDIENESLLIIDDLIKEEVIESFRKTNKLIDIKFMSFSEFKKKYMFDYDKKTIYYLMNKYNYKYEVCKVYLDNLYYITKKDYKSDKLVFLKKLKDELDNEMLLIYDEYFIKSLEKKKIYVYSKKIISKFYKTIFDKLNVNYIKDEIKEKEFNVYELDNIEEEVNFVCNKIIELINNNVDINNIKLLNVKDEYMYLIRKLFNFYNIPLEIKNKTNIYSTSIGKYFLDNINKDKIEIITLLQNKYKNNIELVSSIINIINDYTWASDLSSVKDLIIYDMKNTYVKEEQLKNKVSIISLGEITSPQDYVFLIDFNDTDFPSTYKDEEYISDFVKSEVALETTKEKNMNSKIDALNYLKGIDNLIISYKLENKGINVNISTLSEDMKIKKVEFKDSFDKSNIYNKIRLSEKLDTYTKYGEIKEDTSKLLSNYMDIDYLTYDNTFKGLDKNKLSSKILLSYSSLDSYYRCSFRYYIDNVLKLSIYEETFMTFIGSLYHYILSIMDKENFDLEKEYNKYILESNISFTKKEEFFLEKLKEELQFVVETIKEQYKYSSLENKLYEEKIYINNGVNKTFMGIVDKIMYEKVSDKTIVEIIDYKTGNPTIDINNIIYGIGMQLPIYLYLVSKNKRFENVVIGGFYLQKVLNGVVNKDEKKNLLEIKRNNLKLQGYSNSDPNVLKYVDSNYTDSKIVQSLKTSSKGFYSYSKVLNEDDINKIVNIVEEKISDAFNSISNADFKINPKRIGTINKGCSFCKYNDICYKKENDIVSLKEVRFGGEE